MTGVLRSLLAVAAIARSATNSNNALTKETVYYDQYICTDEQFTAAYDLWVASITPTSACGEYVVNDFETTLYQFPCSAAKCIAELEALAPQFPNCTVVADRFETAGDRVLQKIDNCKDNGVYDFTPEEGIPSDMAKGVCTPAQITETYDAYQQVAELPECHNSSIVLPDYVGFLGGCETPCITAVIDKLTAIPDCYNELESRSVPNANQLLFNFMCTRGGKYYLNEFHLKSDASEDPATTAAPTTTSTSAPVETTAAPAAQGSAGSTVAIAAFSVTVSVIVSLVL